MKIKEEIEKYAEPRDKKMLLWLADHYHYASEWRLVARFTSVRYGNQSYEVYRKWEPTEEGVHIYNGFNGVQQE